jgi:ketosteroid isomerase-like protein
MKRRILVCFIVIYLSPHFGMSQTNSADENLVYNTMVLIGNAWSQNNQDTLEKYIHKDYKHSDVRGQILDRKTWLDYVKDRKLKNVTNPKIEFEDMQIKIYGNFAFVTGINIFSGQAYTANDNNVNKARKIRFTQVLMKENNIWKRILFQATYIEP